MPIYQMWFYLAMMKNMGQYGNVALFAFFLSLCLGLSNESGELNQLPYCGNSEVSASKRLVFVSTLDGQMSALNIDEGTKEWSVKTGPGPLLSSSIHTLELTNNGQLVRMIPSLNGGLYKFDGDHVQPIPVTAEKLLESSFRYSDDIVISGGKEIRSYGVDSRTGKVLYECSMDKCDNLTSHKVEGDVVVIQRQSQTVRAVEPRTGIERWNFSVGEHNLKLVGDPSGECHEDRRPAAPVVLKVVVPDGVICAVSTSSPSRILWQHKFEVPVVSAWRADEGRLQWVDLFTAAPHHLPGIPHSPLLYIGMYNKQVYIQESVVMQRKLLAGDPVGRSVKPIAEQHVALAIPWRPVPASVLLGISGMTDPVLQITDESQAHLTTGLSVLYGTEFVNGNGFYLYGESDENRKEDKCEDNSTNSLGVEVMESSIDNSEQIHPQSLPTSLLFYWKEILLITVTTAIGVNFFNRRGYFWQTALKIQVTAKEGVVDQGEKKRTEGGGGVGGSGEVPSRYLADFQPVQCLGRGGFGTVFQARNKIDDCHYAIKRIPLPDKEESRERVMREVKALAKLDHQHIVRYFNAWLESPAAGPAAAPATEDNEAAVSVDLTGLVTPVSELSLPPLGSDKRSTSLLDWCYSLYSYFRQSETRGRETESEDGSEEEERSREGQEASDSFIVFDCEAGATSGAATTPHARPNSLPLSTVSCSSPQERNVKRGEARVLLYIQMQLCRRESLREWLESGERRPEQVYSIFNQIVSAVEYVHLQGLIHRDLKPSNIFFSLEGDIKVGDFGLVTAMGEADDHPPTLSTSPTPAHQRHTARVGTHLYMSPEQMVGVQYSYKVDIFSLGLILFELLVPFSTHMERTQVLTSLRQLHFPHSFKTSFPHEYKLLKLMLSPQPDERPTTIGIRYRAPLRELQSELEPSEECHFSLKGRRTHDSSLTKC